MTLLESLPPEWRITAYYLVCLAMTIAVMKMVSVWLDHGTLRERAQFLLFSPALSADTWKRTRPLTRAAAGRLVATTAVIIPPMWMVFGWFPTATSGYHWSIRSYLAIVPFWLLIEMIHLVTQLGCVPFRRSVPSFNDQPLASRTVAEFWGRRWNRLFGDWFRQVCFRPIARHSAAALVGAFSVSGLMHEVLVSLPLWLVYRVNCFGWILTYFLIQLLAILAEKRWLRRSPALNRAFVWLAVLGPVPLVLNQGTLLIFHLAVTPEGL
jgi:hypothetical protein